MNHFSEEILAKANKMKSVEELLSLAKENDIPLTREQAQEYYTQLTPKSGELSDEELDNVGGGGCASNPVEGDYFMPEITRCDLWTCKNCGSTKSKGVSIGRHMLAVCEGCNFNSYCITCSHYLQQVNRCSKSSNIM
jgi:hypothetical protein